MSVAEVPTILDTVLGYVAQGWAVVPVHSWDLISACCTCGQVECPSPAKHPRTAHGLRDASTDADQVRKWAKRWPGCNWAICTGSTSDLVVLDIDGEDGRAALAQVEIECGRAPEGLRAQTGGGGLHLLFRRPPGGLRNKVRILPGVDVRGDGGYIVAPPSLHASGCRYRWEDELLDPADPAWLVAVLARYAPAPEVARPAPAPLPAPPDRDVALRRASAYLAKQDPAISGQGGHSALWAAAVAMVQGFALAPSDAYGLLATEYNPRCVPPWSERELRHKVDQAAEKSTLSAGYLLAVDRPAPSRTPAPIPEPPWWLDELPPEDAPPAPPPGEEEDEGPHVEQLLRWIDDQLERGKGDAPKASIGNVVLLLEHDPVSPYIWRNTFDLRVYMDTDHGTRPIADQDYSELRLQMADRWGVSPGEDSLQRWADMVAARQSRNPLADYLLGLRWDGEERASQWLRSAAGVGAKEEAEGSAAGLIWQVYARKFLVQCVARALDPGCKVDTMLVLVGDQGIKKSSLFHALAGDEYFVDSSLDPTNKDTYLLMYKAWIMEYSELSALRRSDAEAIKSFLTRPTDVFRPPYGRVATDFRRHTVFVGTTNERGILRDPTGSRRFWPVACRSPINLEWVQENRDQLWAEAVVAWQAGEQWWLTAEEEELRVRASRDFEDEDPWQEFVLEAISGRTLATVSMLIGHLIERKAGAEYDRSSSIRVTAILRGLGWIEGQRQRVDGKPQRVWTPPLNIVPTQPDNGDRDRADSLSRASHGLVTVQSRGYLL